ncbi:MAG: GNAT family N-acetyltransferase [Hyphomicrobiales bacterium]
MGILVSDEFTSRAQTPIYEAIAKQGDVQVQIVTDLAGIEALETDWRALEAKVADGLSYFQGYDWCYRWIKSFITHSNTSDDTAELCLFTVRRSDKIAAIFPLVRITKSFGIKTIRTLGEPLAQYANILIDTDLLSIQEARTCWQDVSKELRADAIVLDRVLKSSQLALVLDQKNVSNEKGDLSLIMNLEEVDDWDTFQAGFKKTVRRGRRRRFRKIEEEVGAIELHVHFGGSQEYKDSVKLALEYKMIWLKENGRNMASFSDVRAMPFLADLDGDREQLDGAIAYVMTIDGKPVAIEIGFLQDKRYYCFLGAFDWEMRSYSLGKVQMEQSLKWAIENGIKNIDFLGNYEAYQGDWSNSSTEVVSYGAATSLKGMAYANLWEQQLKPNLKKVFRRLPPSVRKGLMTGLATR